MNINPLGGAANVAGTPLAQAKGSDVERARGEVGAQRRQVYHERKAEAAAGVGEPDGEDHETADRDADGRRPWEARPASERNDVSSDPPRSKDPLRQSGNLLDLNG